MTSDSVVLSDSLCKAGIDQTEVRRDAPEQFLQQLRAVDVIAQIGADRYARTELLTNSRQGHRDRPWDRGAARHSETTARSLLSRVSRAPTAQ